MTCIIGAIDKKNESVWLGGDSLGSNGWSKAVMSQSKVFRHSIFDYMIMGSTGSFRHIDLLKYEKDLLDEIDYYKNPNIDHEYIVKNFIPKLISLFQDGIKDEIERNRGANFIVGIKDKLFEIQQDYSVLEPYIGFCSVGSGLAYANGSMYALKDSKGTIPEKIALSLEAAEQCGCGVQRPFKIINTKTKEEIIIT